MQLFINTETSINSDIYDSLTVIKKNKKKQPSPTSLFIGLVILVVVFILYNSKPFIEYDENSNPILAPWREEKLIKAIEDLNEAEQYVLTAKLSTFYPCYSCAKSTTIYLEKGMVYKYGFTTKGQLGRYKNSLQGKNLLYFTQLKGTIEACMKEERRKIYYYALLPENLSRANPLIRPPGNKQDN